MIIERPYYLNRLIRSKHNGLIKIVTGIRRCGKSFLLLNLFHKHLAECGVAGDHIIQIPLDDRMNEPLRDPDNMLSHLRARVNDDDQYYIILDEVQMMRDFEDVLNSLLHMANVDVYVTGSNSRFLSSDIATEFRGRGEQIHIYPLSFSEFFSVYNGDRRDAWLDYYTFGGLPKILSLPDDESRTEYLKDLYRTIYLQDVIDRYRIKNTAELDELVAIIASAIGSPTNPTKLSNTFKSLKHVNISTATISRYLDYLADAFLIEKSLRYNIKGKRYINTLAKHYFTDIGLRNAILDFRQQEVTHIMENVIYNHLRMRGFLVDVGYVERKTTDASGQTLRQSLEVDFVANKGNRRYYVQSAYAMPDPVKEEQEKRSLTQVGDSFKKVIITGAEIKPSRDQSGILTINVIDFLLDGNSLDL